jgi:hypothetical protein
MWLRSLETDSVVIEKDGLAFLYIGTGRSARHHRGRYVAISNSLWITRHFAFPVSCEGLD